MRQSALDIEMRRVKGTLRGLNPTLLRVKGYRNLTNLILTLTGSDPSTCFYPQNKHPVGLVS
jgi:hypothetical protein